MERALVHLALPLETELELESGQLGAAGPAWAACRGLSGGVEVTAVAPGETDVRVKTAAGQIVHRFQVRPPSRP